MAGKQNDTFEQIIAEAIEREKRINKEHPERHGYGMVDGEADDLIRRLEAVAKKEELAQRVKSDRLVQRIKIVNNDYLYSHSPEEIALRNIYRDKVNRAEKKVMDELSARSREIYGLRDIGEKLKDIGAIYGIHVSNVSRDYYKSVDKLREELYKILGQEREQ